MAPCGVDPPDRHREAIGRSDRGARQGTPKTSEDRNAAESYSAPVTFRAKSQTTMPFGLPQCMRSGVHPLPYGVEMNEGDTTSNVLDNMVHYLELRMRAVRTA